MLATLWVVSIAALLLFTLLAAINLMTAINNYVLKRRWASLIPLIGGISGMIGIVTLPVEGVLRYWWVPFFADYGSAPIIIHAIVHAVIAKANPR